MDRTFIFATIILSCLAALAAAAPQFQEEFRPDYRPIAILRDEREDYGDGNFRYEFETENGILVNAVGAPGSKGQSNIQGFYRFPLDDGTIAEVSYIADELGYQPQSPLIPTPHPLPAHAIEQIRFAEEQRAAGVTWDQYGFRLTR
ncbi:cuticle protein AM1199-like isoform X1 [Eriocheir sinensis]|uniref:cuticle protein AM1199-like isoform X1 n=1 Tax=Eriocheir sinensis TaxID=95602 RepID=UPI0021C740BE|nr:cuticle protein AM1199-like isoform X1 [Eriocheir sinensis]